MVPGLSPGHRSADGYRGFLRVTVEISARRSHWNRVSSYSGLLGSVAVIQCSPFRQIVHIDVHSFGPLIVARNFGRGVAKAVGRRGWVKTGGLAGGRG